MILPSNALYLLADRARTVVVRRFWDGQSRHFNTVEVRGPDTHRLAQLQRVIAAHEWPGAAVRLRIVAHHRHPHRVQTHGIPARQHHARFDDLDAGIPHAFAAANRLDAVDD